MIFPWNYSYRVAHLGFLVQGYGDEGVKGNFGIWDQVKTLEWVKDNIGHFGGNPHKVRKICKSYFNFLYSVENATEG